MQRFSDKKWLKIGLLTVAGLLLAGGLVWAGIQIGKQQAIRDTQYAIRISPIPSPLISPSPILLPTFSPEATLSPLPSEAPAKEGDEAAGWKSYINDFAKFTLQYPISLGFSEKSFSEKEKQVVFSGREGKLTINMATTDISPGWGGGCDENDAGYILFLAEQVKVCIGDRGMRQLYAFHPSGKWQLNLYADFFAPYKENREIILRILSTFKFLD